MRDLFSTRYNLFCSLLWHLLARKGSGILKNLIKFSFIAFVLHKADS